MLILHVPHASTAVPPDVQRRLLLDDAQLADELRLMTDSYADELFAYLLPDAVVVPDTVSGDLLRGLSAYAILSKYPGDSEPRNRHRSIKTPPGSLRPM